MDIQFDGFQQSVSLTWAVLLLVVVLGISYWTYFRVEGLTPAFRWILTGLRAAAFTLLLLLLLNPVIALHDQLTHPLRIALVLDNSQSTGIEKGQYRGAEHYEEIIRQIVPGEGERFRHVDISSYGFDADFFPLESPFDLDYSGSRTNIDHALTGFMDIFDREEAVILVTDGIVTSGRDPSASSSRMPVPVFTVGIGDTTRQNDIVVQRVSSNPTASLNSTLSVEASILNEGFPDQDIAVQLRRDEEVLDEATIRSSEQRSIQQVRFELALEEEGLQQFNIHVPELEGEWTAENNTRFFSVNVRDDRIRILHLAFEVHPDVRVVRSFLREDQQVSLENRTWTGGDRYVEGELPDRPDTLDLVILHGFPHTDLPASEAAAVADRFGENALFIIGSPGQEVRRLSAHFPGILPLQFEDGYSWHDVSIAIAAEHAGHTILDFDKADDFRPESVGGGIRNVTVSAGAEVLLQSVYRGSRTNTPLLGVRTAGDRHIAHLNGYGFFRWALSTRNETRDFWEHLLNNTTKWTAARPDDELLDLRPSDPVFQAGEPVILDGFLRNEAGDPEPNGVVEVEVGQEGRESRRYVMSNEGEGRYQLEITGLPEGVYEYEGTASRSDREIDTRSGRFTIGGVNREYVNTIRDDAVLEQIASLSGGQYLPHEEAADLPDLLEERLGFEQRTETVTRSISLHRHPIWFILLIVMLTAEWSLRKYKALA
ncbi:VWA domain-containing protein [Balneolales bacterium ANBcel1]|nr:VWA domain-containing protein [Balneolales bacterium ANBcel1]